MDAAHDTITHGKQSRSGSTATHLQQCEEVNMVSTQFYCVFLCVRVLLGIRTLIFMEVLYHR